MLLTTIKTDDKFEYLWNKIKILGGVLQTEHQLLTNKEVYSVLTLSLIHISEPTRPY